MKARRVSKAHSGKRHGHVFVKPISDCIAYPGGAERVGRQRCVWDRD